MRLHKAHAWAKKNAPRSPTVSVPAVVMTAVDICMMTGIGGKKERLSGQWPRIDISGPRLIKSKMF